MNSEYVHSQSERLINVSQINEKPTFVKFLFDGSYSASICFSSRLCAGIFFLPVKTKVNSNRI